MGSNISQADLLVLDVASSDESEVGYTRLTNEQSAFLF